MSVIYGVNKNLTKRIEALEKRIEELERRPVFVPQPYPVFQPGIYPTITPDTFPPTPWTTTIRPYATCEATQPT